MGGGSVLVVRPRAEWVNHKVEGNPDFRGDAARRSWGDAEVVAPKSRVADRRELSFGAVMEARRVVEVEAGRRGLKPRPPTEREAGQGWTEVYDDGAGAVVRVREERLGRWVEVGVSEGKQRGLRRELAEALGVEDRPRTAGKDGAVP